MLGRGSFPSQVKLFYVPPVNQSTLSGIQGIVQTGGVLTFTGLGTANAGTVSTTITVPSDAELVIVGWSGFSTTANFFSGGSMTFTKGGADTAMTMVSGSDTGNWSGAMAYLALPDTGSNKTLKWDWIGAGTSSDPSTMCCVTFWKGIDTASPVRGTGFGSAGTQPYTTGTITAVSGDLFVAWCPFFSSLEDTINTWTGLTMLAQQTLSGNADAAWATGSPSGNTSVAALTRTIGGDGALFCISLKPAAISGTNADLNVIEADDTILADAALSIAASLIVTEGADNLTAAGTLAIAASSSPVEVNDTLAATGALVIAASCAVTESGDTLSAAGTVGSTGITADLLITEANDTLSSSGAVAVAATLSAIEANDGVSAAASIVVGAALTALEANDTLSAASTHPATAILASTEANDTLTADGTVPSQGINASLSVTETNDTLSAADTLPVTAILSVTEAADTLTAATTHPVTAALAANDNDTLVANGTGSGINASLAITEAADIVTAAVTWPANLPPSIVVAGGGYYSRAYMKKIRDEVAAEKAMKAK